MAGLLLGQGENFGIRIPSEASSAYLCQMKIQQNQKSRKNMATIYIDPIYEPQAKRYKG